MSSKNDICRDDSRTARKVSRPTAAASLTEVKLCAKQYRANPSLTDEMIFSYLSALDSPVSLKVWLLWKHKEYQQLVDVEVNPLHYRTAFAFRDDYAASLFLAKADFIPLLVSKKEAAIAKFLKFEEQCNRTNTRFLNPLIDTSYNGTNASLLHALKRKIELILGEFDGEEFVDSGNWGPGSSTLLRGAHVSGANKFDADNGITRDLYALVSTWFPDAYPVWWKHLTSDYDADGLPSPKAFKNGEAPFHFAVGNKIVTVPKNSKTDRVIAIEPGINLWFQKSIGTMIGRRLQRRGVDLRDQGINQDRCRMASLNGELATIDFSSASDSISKALVDEIIPHRWLQLMTATRSPLGVYGAKVIKWNKFSSMGNGFTFELESLIFFAAGCVVCNHLSLAEDVSVYGDDVILPCAAVPLFQQFSEFLGFTVNEEKSFSSSYFRESCGHHYFAGCDVKPLYLKARLQTIQSVYKLANSIRLLAHRRNSFYGCDARLLDAFRHLSTRVPKSLRLKVPSGYGDGGFVSNFDEACPSRARHGLEGFRVLMLSELGVTQVFERVGMLLDRLWVATRFRDGFLSLRKCRTTTLVREYISIHGSDLSDTYSEGSYTLRKKTRLTVSKVLVPQWYDMGPWI